MPNAPNWDAVASQEKFRSLLREKRRFLVPSTLFFMVYYFALLILVGYFPDLMTRAVWGPVNLAYLFALSQFVMAWILAWLYVRASKRFDQAEAAIRKEQGHS